MAPTLPPTEAQVSTVDEAALSTGAIVMIAVGVYVFLVIIALIIRECLKAQGVSICPAWISEQCCSCCAGPDDGPSCCSSCLVSFAEMCDCSTPSKKSCMDSVCPTKEWCDQTFCCCMNAEPGGELCQDCEGPECSCGTCNCACQCEMPESLNCICFTIQLK